MKLDLFGFLKKVNFANIEVISKEERRGILKEVIIRFLFRIVLECLHNRKEGLLCLITFN